MSGSRWGAACCRCSRPARPTSATALADVGLASVEWKLDGARIQVHRRGDDVRIYTRNLNDITGRLPGVVEWARALPVRAVVLDGEAIGVDDEARPHAFQDTMSSFGRDRDDRRRRRGALDAFFFDVLHVDGDDLIDRPLGERLERRALARGGAAHPRAS